MILLAGCTAGKKAFESGNYYGAVHTSVERLRSSPDHKKAAQVLKEAYPMALKWTQDEIDLTLSSNDPQKWDRTVSLMQQVNNLANTIRQSPGALRIIPQPKIYTSEMNMAREKGAEENYQNALSRLSQPDRQSAKQAYFLFGRSLELVPGYRDAEARMHEAKQLATTHVVVEPIPVHSALFQLSADFFYNQVFEYLNGRFPAQSFVQFYSPEELKVAKINAPDLILRLEFFDFVVGNIRHSESEKEATNTVKIETKDTTKVSTVTYKAKIKTFTDQVSSGGVVDLKIADFPAGKLLLNDRIPGEFVWVNQYALFVGDEKALSPEQLRLTRNKALPPPPAQNLFIEFTKPIYNQLTGRLNQFFRQYN